MRGVSDAQETLGAQELKTDNATDSYRRDKANIVKLARDAAEIMLDLSLRVYSDEKIARICGFDFLQPEHQARFAEALARLRDDKERLVRIDFETDSTSFRDDAKEIERQNLIAKTVLDGLAMIGRMENLQFMGVAIQTLLSVLEAIGGSTQTEDSVKKAVKALEEAKNQPPPPPPPKSTTEAPHPPPPPPEPLVGVIENDVPERISDRVETEKISCRRVPADCFTPAAPPLP